MFTGCSKKSQMRGARFSLFVFVARVRITSTRTYHEHDFAREAIERNPSTLLRVI